MIHYNPEKHYHIIFNELKKCFAANKGFDRPISPKPKKGEHYMIVNHYIYTIEEETLLQLEQEAHLRWKEDIRIKFAEELGVSTEAVNSLVEYAYFAKLLSPQRKGVELDAVEEALKIQHGSTSFAHYEHLPYYLQGKQEKIRL